MPAIRQTSTQQLEHMIRFIEKNPTASGPNLNQSYTGKTNHRAWNTLMHQLNALEGNKKSAENWRKYWNHLKHRTKIKIIEYQKFKRSPKNFARRVPPLDSYQKRIWRILLREKNKEINATSDTAENETEDDLFLTKEIDEDPKEAVETVIIDVKKCPDAQMEDLEPPNTDFDYFLVDNDNLNEKENNLLDHSKSIQETFPISETESAYKKTHNYVKTEIEEEFDELEEDVNEEEDVATKKRHAKRKPHRISKETNSDLEDENENTDLEIEIAKLQRELLKKQILVEEHKLFQIKLQNEVIKKQLQEESEKYSHNHMKRLIEKEELQKNNLDKYTD